MNFLARVADLIHADGDALALAQGLTVTKVPGGRRSIHDPKLPALLEARRARARAHGLDRVDQQLLDPSDIYWAARSAYVCAHATA